MLLIEDPTVCATAISAALANFGVCHSWYYYDECINFGVTQSFTKAVLSNSDVIEVEVSDIIDASIRFLGSLLGLGYIPHSVGLERYDGSSYKTYVDEYLKKHFDTDLKSTYPNAQFHDYDLGYEFPEEYASTTQGIVSTLKQDLQCKNSGIVTN